MASRSSASSGINLPRQRVGDFDPATGGGIWVAVVLADQLSGVIHEHGQDIECPTADAHRPSRCQQCALLRKQPKFPEAEGTGAQAVLLLFLPSFMTI
jgi:hypothetical protein